MLRCQPVATMHSLVSEVDVSVIQCIPELPLSTWPERVMLVDPYQLLVVLVTMNDKLSGMAILRARALQEIAF